MRDDIVEQLDPALATKLAACGARLEATAGVAVGFSGGVDSTLLTALAVETLGADRVLAVMDTSCLHPRREVDRGRRLAGLLGVDLTEIQTVDLSAPAFAENPPDRCYHCKKGIFGRIAELAADHGLGHVASGANADDTGDYRPGLQAEAEMEIVRPLLEAGMSKHDIRRASRALQLPTWSEPSRACLASRIPYGEPIAAEKLARIEAAEEVLAESGFSQYRVRDHGQLARIEVLATELDRLTARRGPISQQLRKLGYAYVTLDLEGFRSGSMNELLKA